MSRELLIHPTKSLNIFIKIYEVNVQSAFAVQVINNNRVSRELFESTERLQFDDRGKGSREHFMLTAGEFTAVLS